MLKDFAKTVMGAVVVGSRNAAAKTAHYRDIANEILEEANAAKRLSVSQKLLKKEKLNECSVKAEAIICYLEYAGSHSLKKEVLNELVVNEMGYKSIASLLDASRRAKESADSPKTLSSGEICDVLALWQKLDGTRLTLLALEARFELQGVPYEPPPKPLLRVENFFIILCFILGSWFVFELIEENKAKQAEESHKEFKRVLEETH